MVRVPKVTSIDHLVGSESVEMGELTGPEGHALLAEIDRKLADLDRAKRATDDPSTSGDDAADGSPCSSR